MENDLVKLNANNYYVIIEKRSRIERLFDVHIEVTDSHEGTWSCKISPKTSSSQESTLKAKIYIQSVLGEGDQFSKSVVAYNAYCLSMILRNQDFIETQTAVVIVPSQNGDSIKIQGSLDNILIAKNMIDNLIRQQTENVLNDRSVDRSDPYLYKNRSVDSSDPYLCLPKSSQNTRIGIKQGGFTCNTGDQTNLDQCYSGVNTSETELTQSNSDINVGETKDNSMLHEVDHHGPNISQPYKQIMSTPQQDGSTESSDSEDMVHELQNNPDYQAKFQFAVKLGYQENDLLRALEKLGIDAGQNELLSELIKQGTEEGDSGSLVGKSDVDDTKDNGSEGTAEPGSKLKECDNLRHIIIDGSNIAMSHGNKEMFSCHGIKLAVDWFRERGHKDITVFVPQWRKETSRSDSRMKDQAILNQLEKDKVLVFTPARRIGGKRVVCYDDRYILKLAVETDGIVVSNDNYRDLLDEKEEFKKVIEERLLMYSFVNDRFMPPDDPLGRNGPTLEAFLQKEPSLPKSLPPLCPYGSKKCTYGNKCKFYHPERRNTPQKSVTEKLAEQAKQRMIEVKERSSQEVKKPLSRSALCRTKSLNPSELSKPTEQPDVSVGLSGSTTNLNTKEDESKHIFNQKLSENLRKMVKEKDSKEAQLKIPEKKVKKKNKENQASPRWNFQPGGVSPGRGSPRGAGGVSPRGTSPVSNLVVPGLESDFDDDEKFLSGHLLLAKKLSDEANECDKNKKQAEKLYKESPLVSGPSSGLSYHFGDINPTPMSEPPKTKHRPPQKQSLSRQLSLQGTDDPRLQQGHTTLKPQYSFGGSSQHSLKNMPNSEDRNSMMLDFMRGQSQGMPDQQITFNSPERFNQRQSSNLLHSHKPSLARMSSEGFTPSAGNEFLYNRNIPSHTPLARMQSAPDPHVLQHQVRSPPRMTRQNSSSDTQLNKLDSLEDPQLSGGRPLNATNVDTMYPRGTLPGSDVSHQISFQFGGQPAGVSHGRSMGSHHQNVPFIPMEMRYKYPTNQHVNPQMYEGQPYDIPHRNINNTGSYAFSNQPGIGQMYPGMGFNQSMYGSRQPLGLGPPGANTGHQGPVSMAGHSQTGTHNFNTGPPHFLDQQTSRIWGNNNAFIPMTSTSGFPGNFQNERQSPAQMSPNLPFQQPNNASPVPSQSEGVLRGDPRYELFSNLCKLFPEEKVRTVMSQHPEADNPNDICAYLIGAK